MEALAHVNLPRLMDEAGRSCRRAIARSARSRTSSSTTCSCPRSSPGRRRSSRASGTSSGRATCTSTRRSTPTPSPTHGVPPCARWPRSSARRRSWSSSPASRASTGLMPDWSMDGGGLHQTLRGRPPQHPRGLHHPPRPRELGAPGQHPALPQRGVEQRRVGRRARAVGPGDDGVPGEGDARRQPDAGVHHDLRQLPRSPRPARPVPTTWPAAPWRCTTSRRRRRQSAAPPTTRPGPDESIGEEGSCVGRPARARRLRPRQAPSRCVGRSCSEGAVEGGSTSASLRGAAPTDAERCSTGSRCTVDDRPATPRTVAPASAPR